MIDWSKLFKPGGWQQLDPKARENEAAKPWMDRKGFMGANKGDLLLAGMGMLSGRNFQEGMGNAGNVAYGAMERSREADETRKQSEALMKAMSGMDMTPQQRAIAQVAPNAAIGALSERAFAAPKDPI